MYRLWIEEQDGAVWHDALQRISRLDYRAACGWLVSVRHTRVWPQKSQEIGPPDEDRCHACVTARLPG